MLMEQKASCNSMIDEKNKLIHDFQQVKNIHCLFIDDRCFAWFRFVEFLTVPTQDFGPVFVFQEAQTSREMP